MKSTTATEIAKKALVESRQVGRQEMAIRRTNAGIAGDIADKIFRRQTWAIENEHPYQLTINQQSELLAESLDADELEYISNNF